MHLSDMNWWRYAAGRWIQHWHNKWVLEVGSFDVNGNVRPLFHSCEKYIGVDWREGPNVDKICLGHELRYMGCFGAVISSSMLEHDPHWEKTIPNMVRMLRNDGVLILSWGAAGNPRHCAPSCPDYAEAKAKGEHMGLHHALPAGKVLKLLDDLGCAIQEFRYQDKIPFNKHCWEQLLMPSKGAAARVVKQRKLPFTAINVACLVAFKHVEYLTCPQYKHVLKPEDEA